MTFRSHPSIFPRRGMPDGVAALAALLALSITALPAPAFASEGADCGAGDGSFLVGTVIAAPRYKSGPFRKGVQLSHTHIQLRGDVDHATYDIALDNVFAAGYQPNEKTVPAPLSGITVGERLELCGLPYSGGMHWVHTNCGDTPTREDPNGWTKIIAANGSVGENLEGSQTYCYLWQAKGKKSRRV